MDIQLGRRNLSAIQRIAVAEKYRPIYERQAQENQSKAGGDRKSEYYQKSLTENLPQVISAKERNPTTDKKLSDIAGVSEKTHRMGAKVLHSDNDALKQEVLSGENIRDLKRDAESDIRTKKSSIKFAKLFVENITISSQKRNS